MLGRAVYHARLLQTRAHGRREPLAIRHQEQDSERPLAALTPQVRKDLVRIFRRAQRGRVNDEAVAVLRQVIRGLIAG
mgnify:CR=1 FL=1